MANEVKLYKVEREQVLTETWFIKATSEQDALENMYDKVERKITPRPKSKSYRDELWTSEEYVEPKSCTIQAPAMEHKVDL